MVLPVAAWAKTSVVGYRIADNFEHSRFVLDVSGKAAYSVILLQNPNRLVVDLVDGAWTADPSKCFPASSLVKKVRHGRKDAETLRIVLDLAKPVTVKTTFQIPPRDGKSYRIVVDMQPGKPQGGYGHPVPQESAPGDSPAEASAPEVPAAPVPPMVDVVTPTDVLALPPQPLTDEMKEKPAAKPVPEAPSKTVSEVPSKTVPEVPAKTAQDSAKKKVFPAKPAKKVTTVMQRPLIVLDPGHGGDDPGAIGKSFKTYEKALTLQFAQLLKKQLEKTGRYRVEMTRTGDYFIRLEDRVMKARQQKAHIFISLHADSHPQPNMRGLSVYTLAEKASDKESEALAAKENKSDMLKGVDLKGQSSEVATILLDLMQRETKNKSAEFAETAVKELAKMVRVLPNPHRFAGFRVLKGIDVAAVLIELGYLSNKEEEKLLITKAYQKKVVDALVTAIDKHFSLQKLEKQ